LEKELTNLKELTPMKIREYFTSVRQQLEEYNDALKLDLENAQAEIADKHQQIVELQKIGGDQADKIQGLEVEKHKIEEAAKRLQSGLSSWTESICKAKSACRISYLSSDTNTFYDINRSWINLRNNLQHKIDIDNNLQIKLIDSDIWKDESILVLLTFWNASRECHISVDKGKEGEPHQGSYDRDED
jgi:hypothetical protein